MSLLNKQQYILVINTAVNHYIALALLKNIEENRYKVEATIFRSVKYKQSEKLLSLVDFLLAKNAVKKEHLKNIVVVNGPGSFTAVRIGVVFANAWNILYPNILLKYTLKQEFDAAWTLKDWKNILEDIKEKIEKKQLKTEKYILPKYNSPVHIG